jgi:hypothetical protein
VRRKGPHSYTEKIEIGKHKKAEAESDCGPHCGGQQVLWLKVEPSIQSLWGDVMEAIVVMDNDDVLLVDVFLSFYCTNVCSEEGLIVFLQPEPMR